MCGLTGFLDSVPHSLADMRARIKPMTASLHHRGPDAHGIWVGEGVALGHRRLSILELSQAGAQPMHSACRRFVIAFNGEIYNHLDLRRALDEAGASPAWLGLSDTETLLAGIVHWGLDETLRKAAGMFALALWDTRERRLLLARDRMGEKPLYWGWAGETLVFGSELKALRLHPGFPAGVCRDALTLYLRFCYVPAPRSIHAGIYKLEPGCVLEVAGAPPATPPGEPLRPGDRAGSVSIRRYWSLNAVVEEGRRNLFTDEAEAIHALTGALETAVSRQAVADVPLGAFLSGGIDSSLIVALMQRQSTQSVKTFTIGFDVAAFNEAPFAAAVARHLGVDHTEMTVTATDAMNVIPSLPDLYDEPFGDSSQIPTHLVCRAARSQVTVALSGDGGDELFGGYYRYMWGATFWKRLGRLPVSVRSALGLGIGAVPRPVWQRFGAAMAGIGVGPSIARLGDKAHSLAGHLRNMRTPDDLHRHLVSAWLDPARLVQGQQTEAATGLDDLLPAGLEGDVAGRMMVQDTRTYLPDDILCKVDRAAMGVSLETRAPFLDPEVVAVSARIAPHMKIRNGQGKWALRQILYDHVPRNLIERPKAGFSVPVVDWLRGPLKPWAEDLLSPAQLTADGLLDPAPIRRAWDEHQSGARDWSHRLWIVLMLQAWRDEVSAA